MQQRQFGIKLRDAAPIWVVSECFEQEDLRRYLKQEGLVYIQPVSGEGFMINGSAVEAICGPNDPKPFDIYRK